LAQISTVQTVTATINGQGLAAKKASMHTAILRCKRLLAGEIESNFKICLLTNGLMLKPLTSRSLQRPRTHCSMSRYRWLYSSLQIQSKMGSA